TYPENVDICLVEGAVANEENLELALKVRRNTKFVVSFGDCAVLGNVPTMRNMLNGADPVLRRCYVELSDYGKQIPKEPGIVPKLLDKVQPLHYYIDVDLYLPGCPPSADRIRDAIFPLLRGEKPVLEGREMLKFG
ncbi:MAG TPA: oxidoreductase, partial [Geminocystis sp. M7585_C2015_104]|nr:oxidoreductase [Geminocystis sp. M7585_C2015_104]